MTLETEKKRKLKFKYSIYLLFILLLFWFGCLLILENLNLNNTELDKPHNNFNWQEVELKKPVIYLYTQSPIDVRVELKYKPGLIATYPEYGNGWFVKAFPDGKLINYADGLDYSYLFWEGWGDPGVNYDFDRGFVVKGKDVADFLRSKLNLIGLNYKEINDFIVYWYPKMKDNNFNLIHFATREEYANRAILNINPTPDSLLRVLMVYKNIDQQIDVQPQEFDKFERKGFVVVEWGGVEM